MRKILKSSVKRTLRRKARRLFKAGLSDLQIRKATDPSWHLS